MPTPLSLLLSVVSEDPKRRCPYLLVRGVFLVRRFLWRDIISHKQQTTNTGGVMEEVAAPTSVAVGSSCGMSLSELAIDLDVNITSRTWAGINKPGGHAKITAIHPCNSRVDVKYVLGGREKNVELIYVRPYVELERSGRDRKRDVKMNVDTLGGCDGGSVLKKKKKKRGSNNDDEEKETSVSSKKGKRTALSSIDGNGGHSGVSGEQSNTTAAVAAAADGGNSTSATQVDNESWTLIKDGKITRHIATLNIGTRIAYWWSDIDGWLSGNIVKVPYKYSTSTTIGYKVGVDFDNGDRNQLLTFNPKEERWRIYIGGNNATTHAQAKKNDLPNKSSKIKDVSSSSSLLLTVASVKDATAKSSKREDVSDFVDRMMMTTTTTTKTATTTKKSSIPTNKKKKDSGKDLLVRYSPASILAVRAAHAKSLTTLLVPGRNTFTATTTASSFSLGQSSNLGGIQSNSSSTTTTTTPPHSTTSIGYSPSLPRGTLSPNEKSKCHSRELKRKVKSTKAYQVSLISPQDPAAATTTKRHSKTQVTTTTGATSTKLPTKDNNKTTTSTFDNAVTLQGLIKRESNKAELFVDYMTASTKVGVAAAAASSPESTESDSLELKLDQDRVTLFNTLLSQVMFKQREDMMDIGDMLSRMNDCSSLVHSSNNKPFTLLEIKPYLQSLHDSGHIFLVMDEGRHGVVYAV